MDKHMPLSHMFSAFVKSSICEFSAITSPPYILSWLDLYFVLKKLLPVFLKCLLNKTMKQLMPKMLL